MGLVGPKCNVWIKSREPQNYVDVLHPSNRQKQCLGQIQRSVYLISVNWEAGNDNDKLPPSEKGEINISIVASVISQFHKITLEH